MRSKILYIALAVTLFAVGVLLTSNICAQKKEIDSLRIRVGNLEILTLDRMNHEKSRAAQQAI